MIVMSETPMRVSFMGGGSDLPAYHGKDVGSVLNTTVDKYVHIVVDRLSELFDYRYRITYSKTELVKDVDEIRHPLVWEAIKLVQVDGFFYVCSVELTEMKDTSFEAIY